ncbi:MAG TPA: GNAT family N-acetyltransferase [Pyrinomonadaceae bacterium]|nr:GNAT family N-acetyltransferase [Pyrinomonadaceae bacterium]
MDEIQESNSTFQELWGMYARGAGGEIVEHPGVLATWAGVRWPIVNVLFLTSPASNLEDLEERLQRVATFTQAKQHPGMLIGCADWLPDNAGSALEKHGWIRISEAYGMVSDDPVDATAPSNLEYRRIEGKELRRAAADINAAGYEVSSEMAREALDHENLWLEGCFGYVGFFENAAVVTSTTYVRDGYLYVALVASLPEFRSRGFARAITSYSIRKARDASSLRRTILHATPVARSLYESLGFRTVTTFPMFLPAAVLAGS